MVGLLSGFQVVCGEVGPRRPGELVAAPAGRKTVSAEPTAAPAADAVTDPETTGSDVQEADDEPAPQEPAAEPDTSDDGRPAWASGNY